MTGKRKPAVPRRGIKETVVAVKRPGEKLRAGRGKGKDASESWRADYLKNWGNIPNKRRRVNIRTGNCIFSIDPNLWHPCVFPGRKHTKD